MTKSQTMQIARLAASGLQTHQILSEHFPACDPWEIHNIIHFDGKCDSENALVQSILKQYPDLAKRFQKDRRSEDVELKLIFFLHEAQITEMKFQASESHRKHSSSE
jgi:hypothetical protein